MERSYRGGANDGRVRSICVRTTSMRRETPKGFWTTAFGSVASASRVSGLAE